MKTYINFLFQEYKPNVLSQKIKHIFKDKDKFKQLKELTLFLPDDVSISERIYHVYHNINYIIICRNCNNPVEFKSLFHGHKSFCSNKCRDEYGNSRIAKEWWISLDITKQNEYMNYYRECYRKIYNAQYGLDVDNANLVPEIRKKAEQTMIERYGFKYAMQNDELYKKQFKSCYKQKEYTLPSGKIIKTQGYTNFALDELLKTYNENNLIIEIDCPKIKYILDNKEHFYRPDIFIKLDNKIIEVKCKYTLKSDSNRNLIKFKATIGEGYNLEIWVYNKKGELLKFNFIESEFNNFLLNIH